MALEVGSRLGHYEVTALIGEGGMGQVYQATDTKLKRQVALKILPEAGQGFADHLALRFLQNISNAMGQPTLAVQDQLNEDDARRLMLQAVIELAALMPEGA